MSNTATLLSSVPATRERFSPEKAAIVLGIHLGAIGALWHTSWAAVAVCFLLHWVLGGLGICVGYHRLLTHRSFRCPRALEYALALFGSLSLHGGPIEWVTHHRQHHQYPDQQGDPHNARQSFWWSHVFWIFWDHPPEVSQDLNERYVPDLLRVPFYGFLARMYPWLAVILALLLYVLGGWPFVVWGVFVRLVLTYHCTFLVNSASHGFGYQSFPTNDLSTNSWWVALLSYGEGWHNNHHAFPRSVYHGLRRWEIDVSGYLISMMERLRLIRDPYKVPKHVVAERRTRGAAAILRPAPVGAAAGSPRPSPPVTDGGEAALEEPPVVVTTPRRPTP
jgi:stearoyl-CoA desaturase (delta-9 desaturase)